MPALSPNAVVIEDVLFFAGAQALRGELAYPGAGQPTATAVLAGPHPLLGGSMQNNVVRALGDGLAARGLVTLRFNYRASPDGASAGGLVRRMTEFWHGSRLAEEREFAGDLDAALAFLTSVAGPKTPLALIGYSFGCTLLHRAAFANPSAVLVLIAPTVGTHDLEALCTLPHPKLVIAPHDDFALDEKEFPHWFDRLTEPKELVRPAVDGHFFRGSEDSVVDCVETFLVRQWRYS